MRKPHLLLLLLALMSSWLPTRPGAAQEAGADVIYSRFLNFRIPFQAGPGEQRLKQLQLFFSTDQGRSWQPSAIAPPEQHHFRFTSDDPEIVAEFHNAFGKEPRSLLVYIPHARPEDAFPTWCEIWGASGMIHRCDGENMFVWLEGHLYVRGTKPCPGGHTDDDPLADSVGRLDIIIPELVRAGYVGYVTIETHSKHDLIHIT